MTAGADNMLTTYPCQAYPIFSASKMISIAAIGHAIKSKQTNLSWDTKVSEYFSWARTGDIRQNFTIRRFLSMGGGLRGFGPTPNWETEECQKGSDYNSLPIDKSKSDENAHKVQQNIVIFMFCYPLLIIFHYF